MATKAFEVKRALKTICDGLSSMDKANVQYGHDEPSRRDVFILKVEWEKSDWATNRSREEKFDVSVRCLATVLAGNSLDAETAIEALTASFEDAIKADPTLGVTGVINSSVVPVELDSAPADGGWVAGIDYKVRITARI